MKYWVFNEQQLRAALNAWIAERQPHGSMAVKDQELIEQFLKSPAARELARKQDVAALDQLELQLLRENRVRPHDVDDEEGLFYHISDRFFPAELRHADAGLRVVWGVMWHCIDCIFLLKPKPECTICEGVGFVEPHDYRVACITDIDGVIVEDFL